MREAHEIQLATYLKATAIEVGRWQNFGKELQFETKAWLNDKKHLSN